MYYSHIAAHGRHWCQRASTDFGLATTLPRNTDFFHAFDFVDVNINRKSAMISQCENFSFVNVYFRSKTIWSRSIAR